VSLDYNEKYHQQMFIFIVILTVESVCLASEAEPFVDLSAVNFTTTEPVAKSVPDLTTVCELLAPVNVTLTDDPDFVSVSADFVSFDVVELDLTLVAV
jgi:hypothetical protein